MDRAVSMCKALTEEETDQLEGRVDVSDCEEKWWSDDPETEARDESCFNPCKRGFK